MDGVVKYWWLGCSWMDALCRGGWMDALIRGGWIDELCSGG